MSELVTPRPTQSADAADDEFESPLTSSPVRPQRRPMRLLAAVASQSPSHLAPRGGLFLPSSAVTTVVRGMRNRFIFGTAASAGPAANEAVPPSITPARTMDEMWSPGASHSSGGEALRRERRMHQPLERNVRGLFCRAEPPTTGKENYDVCQVANSSKKQPAPPASPLPVCCICLEDMDDVKKASQMRCPQCTMQAHARCLSKYVPGPAPSCCDRPPARPGPSCVRVLRRRRPALVRTRRHTGGSSRRLRPPRARATGSATARRRRCRAPRHPARIAAASSIGTPSPCRPAAGATREPPGTRPSARRDACR